MQNLSFKEDTSFKGHHPKGYIKIIKDEEQNTTHTRNTYEEGHYEKYKRNILSEFIAYILVSRKIRKEVMC